MLPLQTGWQLFFRRGAALSASQKCKPDASSLKRQLARRRVEQLHRNALIPLENLDDAAYGQLRLDLPNKPPTVPFREERPELGLELDRMTWPDDVVNVNAPA